MSNERLRHVVTSQHRAVEVVASKFRVELVRESDVHVAGYQETADSCRTLSWERLERRLSEPPGDGIELEDQRRGACDSLRVLIAGDGEVRSSGDGEGGEAGGAVQGEVLEHRETTGCRHGVEAERGGRGSCGASVSERQICLRGELETEGGG